MARQLFIASPKNPDEAVRDALLLLGFLSPCCCCCCLLL